MNLTRKRNHKISWLHKKLEHKGRIEQKLKKTVNESKQRDERERKEEKEVVHGERSSLRKLSRKKNPNNDFFLNFLQNLSDPLYLVNWEPV